DWRSRPRAQTIESAAFLWARHRLADSRLRLDPVASRCFSSKRTGERMLGAPQRHADEKTSHVVCTRPLIHDEPDEHLVCHCAFPKRLHTRSTVTRYHLHPCAS